MFKLGVYASINLKWRILMDRTFVAIKPDGVKRGLIGNIIRRIEHKGYKIVGLKMLQPTLEIAEQHYAEHKGKSFYQDLINYITSGPIVAMVVEGKNVIEGMRHMMGSTVPNDAQVGTIRADFAQTKECNTIHGSDSCESAEREINIYFKPEELFRDWKSVMDYVWEDMK